MIVYRAVIQAVTSTMQVACSPRTHEMLLVQVGTNRACAQFCSAFDRRAAIVLLLYPECNAYLFDDQIADVPVHSSVLVCRL